MGRCALGARLDDVVHRCAEKLLVVGFFAFLRRAVPQRDRPSRYSYDKSNGPKRHAFVRVGADPRFLCINLLNLSKKKKYQTFLKTFWRRGVNQAGGRRRLPRRGRGKREAPLQHALVRARVRSRAAFFFFPFPALVLALHTRTRLLGAPGDGSATSPACESVSRSLTPPC
jgi:hypothetical protein